MARIPDEQIERIKREGLAIDLGAGQGREQKSRPHQAAVGGYAGCRAFLLLLGFLRDCDSRSSGLSMPAIMPVATRA